MGTTNQPVSLAVTQRKIHLDAERVIGQAQGILAERHRLTQPAARSQLNLYAVAAGLPLVEAANWLIATGDLP
jgi:AmiR/NasT family two-component response regulator